ncbi:uncharacterized protein LOC123501567 [Portunus trituberculatus]|uniref:uncharacterized protein LOC123501567 n=1 Tax=Portunus trituberculatus TaxID=210409 RepID=UPI001E1CF597|nr:uncharacterized protein LOC123501567 [Portunus trituberculatus]
MGPTKLDMQEKSMIMALVGEGLSNREIGRKLRRSESAIRRTKKAAAVLGSGAVPERKKGTGRKRKTHPRTDKLLEREVKKDPFITAKELKEEHANVLGEVSVRTIQDRLQKHLKLPCRRTARKPLLTEKMKKQRLDFCKRGKKVYALEKREAMQRGRLSKPEEGKASMTNLQILSIIKEEFDENVLDCDPLSCTNNSPTTMDLQQPEDHIPFMDTSSTKPDSEWQFVPCAAPPANTLPSSHNPHQKHLKEQH